ncbi:alpha/beta fold hydrolase [Spirosoma aerolatum]|uniref:alpha/beta fold hydrolase n=1 Tax=Spirosoma aerolatum TaxID=1211326 RepID=UPI0009ABC228|nr:alpha/beta hydrolase [Spirosoma aerolatum]
MNNMENASAFQHQQIKVEGVSLHVVSNTCTHKPPVLFLHGFPENWQSFDVIMTGLQTDFHVIALDLPGIGQSEKIAGNDKKTIATYVKGVIDALGLSEVTLVGHDVGGMIAYAYLHTYPNELAKAVIMNVAVPAIDPWARVKQNPNVWHFRFNTIPDLPETLVMDRQRPFFDYFFNTISAKPDQITEQARNTYAGAYTGYDALRTAFEWYRAFPQDEKDNEATKDQTITTPVLYLRGEHEYGNMDEYLNGFRSGGLANIQGQLITGSGHYAPDEAPGDVVRLLKEFLR